MIPTAMPDDAPSRSEPLARPERTNLPVPVPRPSEAARKNGTTWIGRVGAAYNATTTDLIPMNSAEVWTVENGGGGWAHPAHIHYEEHRVLTLNGKAPPAAEAGRKDVSGLGPNDEVTIYIQFRDTPGRFVQHCHNVLHEDHAMMAEFQIVTKTGAAT